MAKHHYSAALALALASVASTAALAQDSDWKFGIGTGFSSFGLDGDVGFATPVGGFVREIDLDNGETSDMIDSAIGANAFATNGKWIFNLSFATVTLEDNDADLRAKWDRSMGELSAIYNFAQAGNNTFGILAGVRMTKHEWELSSRTGAFPDVDPNDDWTDGIVGLSHMLQISDSWSWRTRVDAGFGDSEEAYYAVTGIYWQPLEHWLFNVNAKYIATEFGNEDDINDSDFYYYDVDETALGLGFTYVW